MACLAHTTNNPKLKLKEGISKTQSWKIEEQGIFLDSVDPQEKCNSVYAGAYQVTFD